MNAHFEPPSHAIDATPPRPRTPPGSGERVPGSRSELDFPHARPNALATALAHSLTALELRHARLLQCVGDAAARLAGALHGAALGNAVLRRLDLSPEARAIAIQQLRALDLALAEVAALRQVHDAAPGIPGADAHASDRPDLAAEREFLPADLHVLVVDDDAAVRLAMRLLLEMVGVDVRVAADRDAALASAAAEAPDVVVVDWNLAGGTTGEAVLSEIERAAGRVLPGVIVSGDPCVPPPPERRVLLPKPFGVAALLGAVRRAREACVSAAPPAP